MGPGEGAGLCGSVLHATGLSGACMCRLSQHGDTLRLLVHSAVHPQTHPATPQTLSEGLSGSTSRAGYRATAALSQADAHTHLAYSPELRAVLLLEVTRARAF